MAQLPNVFKPSQAQDANVLPAGNYLCKVVKAVMKETNAKDGQYLSTQIKVQDGKYKNRVLFQNFSLVNKNPEAVRIAESQLKGLCEALGIDELEDTDQLINAGNFVAKVKIKAETAANPASNNIVGYATEDKYQPTDDTDPFGEENG